MSTQRNPSMHGARRRSHGKLAEKVLEQRLREPSHARAPPIVAPWVHDILPHEWVNLLEGSVTQAAPTEGPAVSVSRRKCQPQVELAPSVVARTQCEQEAKRNARLQPAVVVALCQAAAKLDCLGKRLFELPLDKQPDLKSHEQMAWLNVTTPAA